MFLRTFSAVASALLLAACTTESPAPEGEMIDCAIGPGAEYSEVCTLEWLGDELDSEFLIHHPDGSFRRFAFDGEHQIVTTDGADPAETIRAISHAFWEFSVGGDRYKLPLPDGYGE